MKISKELSDSYLHCLASSNGNVKTVCDALEQAVAENLELKHKLYHWQKNTFAACSDCPTDELAEAGKLLRGQQ